MSWQGSAASWDSWSWGSGWDAGWESWSWKKGDRDWDWGTWPEDGPKDATASPKAADESERVHAILKRGNTVDQLSNEELQILVKHIDQQQRQQQTDRAPAHGTPEAEATKQGGDHECEQKKDDEEKKDDDEKKESKEERRKRLHARNMRYYRSLESDLVAILFRIEFKLIILGFRAWLYYGYIYIYIFYTIIII